jgi:GT2 family glycosyltransferase/glycosyltransferase involved in cell wall biosynthesis
MFVQITRKFRELNRQRLNARRLRKLSIQRDIRWVQLGDTEIDVVATFGDRSAISPASIELQTSDTPELSIVISAYGKADYTLRCLRSLMLFPPRAAHEVIVIEDASGDPTADLLRQVKGIRYIENESNLGYLRSNNKAVKLSRGAFIHLLNNDTQVLPGAVDALLDLARAGEHHMVGSKLIYPNGLLQEAGGIIWEDGSAWNYGRNDHPGKRRYNYVREVGYCSGASILLRRSTWDAVGGYDEHYLPAYCEDSDLAFKVRQLGGRVLYQPESVVIHDEGVSHGTSTSQGVKQHQITNTEKLRQRWHAEMARDGYPSGDSHLLRARDRSRHKKLVLIIDHQLPEPDRDAGSRTMLAFVDSMLHLGHVVKYWSDDPIVKEPYARLLQQRGVEVFGEPGAVLFSEWIKANGALVDCVVLSRPLIANRYIDPIREHSKAKVIFYGHDLHHARLALHAEVDGTKSMRRQASDMRRIEAAIWQRVDVSLYPSEEEAQVARALVPGACVQAITPYILTPTAAQVADEPAAHSKRLLFVAGFKHKPNAGAAEWLVRDILPHIRARAPDVHLYLVGSNPTAEVKALRSEHVTVTGTVSEEELTAHYRQASVCVVPLRVGAGIKLKTLEAMSHGVPVVATSVGMQGLPEAPFARVADRPEAFAGHVLDLLEADAGLHDIREAELAYVKAHFSAQTMCNAWASLI